MNREQKSIVLTRFIMAITSIFLLTIGNNAFAVEYTKYTSENYGIQFEFIQQTIYSIPLKFE